MSSSLSPGDAASAKGESNPADNRALTEQLTPTRGDPFLSSRWAQHDPSFAAALGRSFSKRRVATDAAGARSCVDLRSCRDWSRL